MYAGAYAEVLAEDPRSARAEELESIERSIALFDAAEAAGISSKQAIEAVYFANSLWSYFLEDLASPSNGLPAQLKASLISIGLFILKECEEIRSGRSKNFAGLASISRTVAEGLR